MAGGRLTYQERERIAAGLAHGLGYNEIAHELGRPGSTVSREVARNGGPRRYRANRAQQATEWRAHRRKPYPAVPIAASGDGDPLAQRAFEDRFAAMMTRTGMPEMASKVLARLFTSDTGSATAADLVARLQVSPASVSKAVAWLEQRRLVGRERDGRRHRYRIDDHASYHAWQASIEAMGTWADLTGQGAEQFGATPAGERMRETSRFFRLLGHDMAQAAEHWRQTLGGPHEPPDERP